MAPGRIRIRAGEYKSRGKYHSFTIHRREGYWDIMNYVNGTAGWARTLTDALERIASGDFD